MAGRGHGDAGREIKKLVAIDIGNDYAASALGDHRVRAGIGRRNVFFIARQHALGIGTGQGGLDLGTDRECFGGHGNSPGNGSQPSVFLWSIGAAMGVWQRETRWSTALEEP